MKELASAQMSKQIDKVIILDGALHEFRRGWSGVPDPLLK